MYILRKEILVIIKHDFVLYMKSFNPLSNHTQ